jgi:two-component system response regulator TctD
VEDKRMSGRLLLIEDHAELSLWLGKALRQRGLKVAFATDGLAADQALRGEKWDLVVLDLSLPGLDGLDLLRRLRGRGDTVPVLVLTARGEVADRVRGLDLGADDYLPKPFELSELEARIAALLRRPRELRGRRTTVGELAFDHEQHAFYRGDVPLALTRRESALLQALFERHGRAVSKEFLYEAVFADGEATLDAVEVLIHRLRKKVEACAVQIVTVRGLGYLLESSR